MLANTPDSLNCVTTIHFPDDSMPSSSYKLLELTDPNLLAAIEAGKDLWIRGKVEDDAVLCTDTQTFRLRELVTSNMFLVVEKPDTGTNESSNGLVVGRPQATLEATPMARPPGIDQLLRALNEAPYDGGGTDEVDFRGNDDIHVTRIYENIQASAKEIEECLKQQGVMVIKDHYRKLGNHLLCRFYELFFNTTILEDWNLTADPINFEFIWKSFQQYEDEFSQSLTEFILQYYSIDGKFDFVKVSRFLAEQFLSARPVWDQEDFMVVWEKSLNDLYKPNFADIADMLLTERHPGSGRLEVKKYLRSELPSDVDSRFISLFRTRQRWQYDDLIPFIRDLGRDTKELDAIVLKHGRISVTRDVRFITPRSQLLD